MPGPGTTASTPVRAGWCRCSQREGADAIDVLVASHAHLDHVGGFGAVLRAMPVGTVVEPATPGTDSTYREMLGRRGPVGRGRGTRRDGASGSSWTASEFTVLHPDTAWSGWGLDLNDDSVVLLVRYGGFRAIFMGDAGEAPEATLRGRVGHVDLLKVGHHGSRTASGTAWLRELSPTVGDPVGGEPQPVRPSLARGTAAARRPACYDLENRSGGHDHRHHRRPPRGGPRTVAPVCVRRDRVARQHQPGVASLMRTAVTTIERFIIDQERDFPDATGELSSLLYDIALATKLIAASIRRAGLVDILGSAQNRNVQGEDQQKLDVLANEAIKESPQVHRPGLRHGVGGRRGDDPDSLAVPPGQVRGALRSPRRLLQHRRQRSGRDDLQRLPAGQRPWPRHGGGRPAAGASSRWRPATCMYGSSTMLVYTTGQGVHGFTLDPTIGEFLLSHPSIVTPAVGKYYSVNESNFARWDKGVQTAVRGFHGDLPEYIEGKNSRYIGSLVADFHRNLIAGGIFMYPADKKNPNGKLRLLYECAPMAFIAEQAGGAATDGERRILERVPGCRCTSGARW